MKVKTNDYIFYISYYILLILGLARNASALRAFVDKSYKRNIKKYRSKGTRELDITTRREATYF
jgi:hypothetical protein